MAVYREKIDHVLARVLRRVLERIPTMRQRRAVEAFLTRVVLRASWEVVAVRVRASGAQEAFQLAHQGKRLLEALHAPERHKPKWLADLETALESGKL